SGRRRGPPAVRAPLLPRRRARPQRRGAAGARRAGGARVRLRRGGVLPGRRRPPCGTRGGAVVTGRRRPAAVSGWLLAAALVLLPGLAVADERTLAYDSVVEVRADGSLEVTEHIRVRA